MKLQTTQLINIACLTLSIVILSPLANAATYRFSQGGYSGRGELTGPYNNGRIVGSFEGEDTNHDGVIAAGEGEMSHFSLNFSGNSFFNNLPDINRSTGFESSFLDGWESFLTFNILTNSFSFRFGSEISQAPGWVDYSALTGFSYLGHWVSGFDVFLNSGGLTEIRYIVSNGLVGDLRNCDFNTGEGCLYYAFGDGIGTPETIRTSTTEPLIVTQTPIPSALWLFASGLAWLGVIRRKKSD
jgi:hypothetical protein